MYRIFIDNRVSDGVARALQVRHAVVIRLPSFWRLPAPVSSHADMLLFPLPDGKILTFREYFENNAGLFSGLEDRMVLTDESPGNSYPRDVVLDALGIGDTLYGHSEATSAVLRSIYRRFVPVRQGYVRCSVAAPSDGAAVTSDRGLAAVLSENGVDVLEITPGHIRLPGYDTGFIGGAGTRLPDGRVIFFGDLSFHPDGKAIAAFVNKHCPGVADVPGEQLSDLGGALIINCGGTREGTY